MGQQTSPSRQQLVAGAADMIRRRGLNATSVREVAKHSRTPQGSTYHYFPGGKQQLAAEAVRYAADTVAGILAAKLRAGPVEGLEAFLGLWRHIITSTDYQAGCPVLAVSIEETGEERPDAVVAAGEAFTAWSAQLAESMREHGVEQARAEHLATLVVASAEGAVAMCRAQRSTRPLDHIATELIALVGAAIGR
ncbi:TetR/AcrR family transcriptional regulator [Amycolatopsis sp. YIM 10]|uniref:TetR/AcrR family transcriptional regulator n=1 Tax=Amycolatopsis sp. YIM 10 TaxID=2653857 RepID=UPI0012903053|nr:helix-turn-helix domain-containing protein [Amycolatopsis sp. YIM 10]QFU87171.1 putative HTH-type transcriptional regulator YxaF [Amycolatopsis sp. YIM 10]